MSYKTLRVSNETHRDLSRALWLAERLNERDGIRPAKAEAIQAECVGRILREWSSVALHEVSDQALRNMQALEDAGWSCGSCGSSGLNRGGLDITPSGVRCAGGCR